MAEYIDREALLTRLEAHLNEYKLYIERLHGTGRIKKAKAQLEKLKEVIDFIKSFPTADAEEVARCYECIWRGTSCCAMSYMCDCGTCSTWEVGKGYCNFGDRLEEE